MQQTILEILSGQPAFQKLAEEIRSAGTSLQLGLARSPRVPVLAAIRAAVGRPMLLITDRTDRALVLEDEWNFWNKEGDFSFFPEPDPLYYEKVAWSRKTRRDRLSILAQLSQSLIPGGSAADVPTLIIAPVRAVMTRTLPRRSFLKASRTVKIGARYTTQTLASEWVQAGYEPTPIVTVPGQFARRGGILDIWPPGDRFPARLEFFGDEVEMLRRFDPQNQRTIQKVDLIRITPAREFLLPEDPLGDLDGKTFTEYHLSTLHDEVCSLLNYLPENTLIVLDDHVAIQDTALEISAQAESLRKGYQGIGLIKKDFPLPYLPWKDFQDAINKFNPLALGPAGVSSDTDLGSYFGANQRFGGELKSFTSHLAGIIGEGVRAVVVSRQSARLEEIWKERTQVEAAPAFIKGSIEGGWVFSPENGDPIHLFSDGEIFGWQRIQPRRKPIPRNLAPEVKYADFQEDDWVVHIDHGIGRYSGLAFRELEGTEGEYLAVEYADGDTLYVPAAQADRLTRYVGPDHHDPTITRLGSERWGQAKSRVKEEVIQVAQDLLDLYARR
ncbi:MAG: hypothetical protein E4H33_05470, partial [Anaerolineales bacterium]